MIVYAVYFILEDGRTILSETYQNPDNIPNEVLFGGLITALQHVAAAMTRNQSEMRTIEIEGLSYHIRSFGLIRVILVTNFSQSPDAIIQTLGMRFLKTYGERLLSNEILLDLNIFLPFKQVISEILGEEIVDGSKSIVPSKVLTTGEIYSLPHELQDAALAMISLKEADIATIATECQTTPDLASKKLQRLQELGYIGKKDIGGHVVFFCSI
ncbi:MAG: hypothetical protein ACFFE8_02865 [Candidatus Heimdallarchaeota archaeon]